MIVKIFGLVDLCAALLILALLLGLPPILQLSLFFGGVLFMKSFFLLTGDALSAVDLISSVIIFITLFFTPWAWLMWVCSLMLMSKGVASFF